MNGTLMYVGIDSSVAQDRVMDHMKPSKYNEQPINSWMQDNDWIDYDILTLESDALTDAALKILIHDIEHKVIKALKPRLNIKLN